MKNQEEFKLDEVKKNRKFDNDDTVYFFEVLIKSCLTVLIIIGIECLMVYGMAVSISTLNKWEIISKRSVVETSDIADKKDLSGDVFTFDVLDWYYILYND